MTMDAVRRMGVERGLWGFCRILSKPDATVMSNPVELYRNRHCFSNLHKSIPLETQK
jgi:hypothetical protein